MVAIRIDQAGKSAGVPGQAREDLATGTLVTLTATGGPYASYLWRVIWKPIDILASTRSSAVLTASTSSATNLTPIDLPGTYFVEVSVDSGSGLGALTTDIARKTFYAGAPLAADPTRFPRRQPAVGETNEHNVTDAIDPGGNVDGWARERARWDLIVQTLSEGRTWAGGVLLTGLTPVPPVTLPLIVRGYNVSNNVIIPSAGLYEVAFLVNLPDASYGVLASAVGPGSVYVIPGTKTASGFSLQRVDAAGAPAHGSVDFTVMFGV